MMIQVYILIIILCVKYTKSNSSEIQILALAIKKNESMCPKSASILFYIKIPRPVLEILHFIRLCYLVFGYSTLQNSCFFR
jgi:hypothetical protein